ncbi:MAG TPA: hypothetical protein VNM37_03855, partial [Candidatus Dormibacteraeota bacterium]|nr:hypothetical protein [Candidatus Dormibacteraeota bacterium]
KVDSAVFIKAASFSSLNPGLVVKKTAPPYVAPGAPLTFTITVQNIGDGTALDVLAWDTIPTGTTLSSLPAPGTLTGSLISWAFGDMGPGISASVQFTVLVNGGTAAVVNRVGGCPRGGYVGGGYGGGCCTPVDIPAIYSEPAATSVQGAKPCLTVFGSTTDYAAACVGKEYDWQLQWQNCGQVTIDNMVIEDTLPAEVSYISGSYLWATAPDALGMPQVTSMMWAPSIAGPWNPGEPPDGTSGPAVLQWTVDRVVPDAVGTLTYGSMINTDPDSGWIENNFVAWVPGNPQGEIGYGGAYTGPEVFGSSTPSATVMSVGTPFNVYVTIRNWSCRTAL